MDVSNVQSRSYKNVVENGPWYSSYHLWSEVKMKNFQLELNEREFSPHQPVLCAHLVFFLCVIRSLIKHLWDVSSCSVKGGAVLHQCAFIVKKNVETLHPINATTSVIPVSNLLPLCGNNFRVYKRVRFPNIVGRTGAALPSACVVGAEPHFTVFKRATLLTAAVIMFCQPLPLSSLMQRDGQQPAPVSNSIACHKCTNCCVTGELDITVNTNVQMEAAQCRRFLFIKLVNSLYLSSCLLGG